MSDTNSNLTLITPNQSNKEQSINDLFNAGSPAQFGGKNSKFTSGLVYGIYGGRSDGVLVNNATLNLSDNAVNYIYFNKTTRVFSTSTVINNDLLLLSVITTANGFITNEEEKRDGFCLGGGGGGGGSRDPNFKSNNDPSTAPIANKDNAIAIGNASRARGINSFAVNGGTAEAMNSFCIGNNNVNTEGSFAFGGYSNTIYSGLRCGIISGTQNRISASSDLCMIVNSNRSTITSYTTSFSMIINSNQSTINSKNSLIINNRNGTIQENCDYSMLIGHGGSVVNPFCIQKAFDRTQVNDLGLEAKTADGSTQVKFNLGNGSASQTDFKLEENQGCLLNVRCVGVSDTKKTIFLEKKLLIKNDIGTMQILNSTVNELDILFAESGLETVKVTYSTSGNRLIFRVTGVEGSYINFSIHLDTLSTYYI